VTIASRRDQPQPTPAREPDDRGRHSGEPLLCVVIVNYRRAALTAECLETLAPEMANHGDRCAVIVDNASDDGSADELDALIDRRGYGRWARLVRADVNRGFGAGNNLAFEAQPAEAYLLLNSDARVRAGALTTLLDAMGRHPEAGLIGPRLEDPDGSAQASCFRNRTPVSELLEAAGTGLLDRVLHRWTVALPVSDAPIEPPWMSFACVLVRRAVLEQIGPMDERYFLYFEDIDFARRARAAGWSIRYEPAARVVHLRGGTSSVKAARAARDRVPAYYYRARSRYFAKFHGGVIGLWAANLMWSLGRAVALGREIVGQKRPHACVGEWRDNWTNALRPLRGPRLPRGGGL
jgi:GT2 family glycosyltransferase